jgi:hypothetical protein
VERSRKEGRDERRGKERGQNLEGQKFWGGNEVWGRTLPEVESTIKTTQQEGATTMSSRRQCETGKGSSREQSRDQQSIKIVYFYVFMIQRKGNDKKKEMQSSAKNAMYMVFFSSLKGINGYPLPSPLGCWAR